MGHYYAEMCCNKCGDVDCCGGCEDEEKEISITRKDRELKETEDLLRSIFQEYSDILRDRGHYVDSAYWADKIKVLDGSILIREIAMKRKEAESA